MKGWLPMFLTGRTRLALEAAGRPAEERRESPRYDAPILVGNQAGFDKLYGTVSLGGCDFESLRSTPLGQHLEIRLRLVGMSRQVAVRGRVIRVTRGRGLAARVAVRFEETPFGTERLIARWLDLLSSAYRSLAA